MFGGISCRYDLLNRLMSLGRDQSWRRRAARLAEVPQGGRTLDLCCGTCDLSLELARLGTSPTVIGLDFSKAMLRLGLMKCDRDGRSNAVHLLCGDAIRPPLARGVFDAVTVAFGLRNIADQTAALSEVLRVLRPGGRFVVLEFSHPEGKLLRGAYHLYLRTIPLFLAFLLRADPGAYRYLARTVIAFPGVADLSRVMEKAGFQNVHYHHLFLGTVAIHVGEKGVRS